MTSASAVWLELAYRMVFGAKLPKRRVALISISTSDAR
jgi:hypothetical protein